MTAVDIGGSVHGTTSGYTRGCRCDDCGAAWSGYKESWEAAHFDEDAEEPLTEQPSALLTVEQTARLLGISRISCYEAVKAEQLPVLRLGRRKFIPRAALERLLAEGSQPIR